VWRILLKFGVNDFLRPHFDLVFFAFESLKRCVCYWGNLLNMWCIGCHFVTFDFLNKFFSIFIALFQISSRPFRFKLSHLLSYSLVIIINF
jgi:hypothetical protein